MTGRARIKDPERRAAKEAKDAERKAKWKAQRAEEERLERIRFAAPELLYAAKLALQDNGGPTHDTKGCDCFFCMVVAPHLKFAIRIAEGKQS